MAAGVGRGARPANAAYALHRAVRITGLVAWTTGAVLVLRALAADPPQPIWLHLVVFPAHVAAAALVADWISGLVHFAADTFGSRRTPILGPMFIAPFRHHHADPKDLAAHDVIDTNGNTAFPAMVPLYLALLMPLAEAAWAWHLGAFAIGLCTFGLLTNQIHKWAHCDAPPAVAAWLQRRGLILCPKHHARHHQPPHEGYYCITSGRAEPLMRWAARWARRRRLSA